MNIHSACSQLLPLLENGGTTCYVYLSQSIREVHLPQPSSTADTLEVLPCTIACDYTFSFV
jgi:hypothetical protein